MSSDKYPADQILCSIKDWDKASVKRIRAELEAAAFNGDKDARNNLKSLYQRHAALQVVDGKFFMFEWATGVKSLSIFKRSCTFAVWKIYHTQVQHQGSI